MKKVLVLGAGMVGSAIAADLMPNFDVTSADISPAALDRLAARFPLKTLQLDSSDSRALTAAAQPFDIVVSAVPGFLGFRTLRTLIEAGKNVVDISFFPENALELDALAKQKGVTAITDIGVAPGMDNLLLGMHDAEMEVTDFECLVGGLPRVRKFPFEYKAPFSPIDVIEEYTRPARYRENGHIVVRPPLTDAELLDFEYVGTLESFNTDGLRSLLFTLPHIPNMKEKTLRYPGHIGLILALKASGFFSEEKIGVGGAQVSPLEFTSKILLDEWRSAPNEDEFTVMRVRIAGQKDGMPKEIVYDLYDTYDPATGFSSMARTTGYTCTAAVNLFAQGLFTDKGVFPPELVGAKPGCTPFVLEYLAARNVTYRKRERELAGEALGN